MSIDWSSPYKFFYSLYKQHEFYFQLKDFHDWFAQDWDAIAPVISQPLVRDWILDNAQLLKTKHIGQYMHRYLFRDDKQMSCARINHILRHDLDPYLHDHPFDWRTIVLKGWYIEEDIFGNFHTRREGYTGENRAETFHRIHQVSPGGVWTLFITGPHYINGAKRNHWGFLISENGAPPRKVPHEVYHSVNGRAA